MILAEDGLILARDSAVLKASPSELIDEKGDALVTMLKKVFIFFPGVLYLFFITISIFTFDFVWNEPFSILLAFVIGGFMTIFGIGDLKNPKHLAIPLSIVSIGIAAFSLFSMLGSVGSIFKYGIYFFPLALIVPFLAKSFVDKTDESVT